MREAFRVNLASIAIALIAQGTIGVAAGQAPAATPSGTGPVAAAPSVPGAFAGTWDYNALESINILTGRPEQAPRSATQGGGGAGVSGRGGGRTAGVGAPSATGGFGATRSGSSGNGGRDLGVGPTPEMMREQRDMSRDLLEVAEQYRISLADGTVTFVDDIERERTYQLGGVKQKYRLGASEFSARVEWTGTQLRKDIEGSLGFRMSETYFLSPDGRRLFVIIRVGQQGRNRRTSGFNRVYDRIDAPVAGTEAAAAP